MSPAGDVRPGWRIVLDAFLAAPGRTLTNIELGRLRGVQAFRSRISDLRRMGCDITEGTYVAAGCYRYRLVEWPADLLRAPLAPARDPIDPAASAPVVDAQDAAAEQTQLFADRPANALTADF